MKRSWAINGRFLAQPTTGVQRYAREIVAALDDLASDGHPLADGLDLKVLVPGGGPPLPSLGLRTIEVREAGKGNGHVWEQTSLPWFSRQGLLSLCNTGPLAHPRHIVCIHDLNTRWAPESYSAPFRALYRILVPALGRTARIVSTVSEFSASQLTHFRVCRPSKIRVIPNGSDHTLAWVPARSEATRALASRETIVVLGSTAPHKNLALIVGIAGDLAKLGFRLAIVGGSDRRVFAGAATAGSAKLPEDGQPQDGRPGNVSFLGRLSDNELAGLLEDCLCLAFPSFTEGFGLPPLEAMARGCPVVASDRASLPEVCGPAALYAAPDDPGAWLDRLTRLRADPEFWAKLSREGRIRASRYSWRNSAEKYLRAMAECDGVRITQPVDQPGGETETAAAGRA